MKFAKFLLVGIAMALIAINFTLSKQHDSFSPKNFNFNNALANPEDPPTVWVDRATRYDCIYYVAGVSFGCTNCAWDCEPIEYPEDVAPNSNCTDDHTCCEAVALWESLFGPC